MVFLRVDNAVQLHIWMKMDPYLMVGLPYGLFLKVYASLKSLIHDQGSQHKSEIDTEIVSELSLEDMQQLCLYAQHYQ